MKALPARRPDKDRKIFRRCMRGFPIHTEAAPLRNMVAVLCGASTADTHDHEGGGPIKVSMKKWRRG